MDEPLNSRDELLRRYDAGERHFEGAELDNGVLDLRRVTREGCDFSESFITADFRGANLKSVIFASANLKTCDFSNAYLRDANFSAAALDATTFVGAEVEGAEFAGASCYSHTLSPGEKPWW